eukprot:jgi/Antlo1/1962/134
MFWFVEEHISFVLCAACGCVVFVPEVCSNSGHVFHRKCTFEHCPPRTVLKNALDPQNRKACFSMLSFVLDLKRVVKSPAIVYSYIFESHSRENDKDRAQTISCAKCHCCGENAQFSYVKPFCRNCIGRIDKNKYCPVCLKTYDPEDYEVEMMCCDFCLRWVHLECDSSFSAFYHKKPGVIKYMCPLCIENAKRWRRLRADFRNSDKNAETCSTSLIQPKKLAEMKVICTYCGMGSASDIVGFLKPLNGTIPTQLAHTCCKNYKKKRCAKCGATGCSIKCWKCSSHFHLKCAEGLFRQDRSTPFCNDHFCVQALHPEYKAWNQENCKGPLCRKKHKAINMLSKDIVYKPLLFTKILFSESSVHRLKFDGKSFYIDEEPADVSRIRERLLLNVQSSDIFRVRSKEYQMYRKMLVKNRKHEELLKALLRIYTGKTRYVFESNA